jgi:L-arginine dehydrogenase
MNEIPICPTLCASAVSALLAHVDASSAMRRAFRALGEGKAVQPPQTVTLLPGSSSDFITYLGALVDEQVFGAKLSPYLARPEGGLVTAWTLLMSIQSGQPLLLCDSKALTVERTAATTALATDLLAPSAAKRLAVIGAGPIARAHVRHVAGLRAWSDIHVYSPSLARSPDRAKAVTALDVRVRAVSDLQEAVEDADVILLCTSSGTPVLNPDLLRKPALITSISTNAPRAHEIPPALLAEMDVYCDFRETAPRTCAEMQIAAAEHGWAQSCIVGDLPELVTNRARPPDYRRSVFFRSVGLGIEDIAIANALYTAHQTSGTAA